MKSASSAIILVFVVLTVLHQDAWNWDNGNLVFGLLPAGLAYHVVYSVVAAAFWALVIKFAWPSALEAWAGGRDEENAEGGES